MFFHPTLLNLTFLYFSWASFFPSCFAYAPCFWWPYPSSVTPSIPSLALGLPSLGSLSTSWVFTCQSPGGHSLLGMFWVSCFASYWLCAYAQVHAEATTSSSLPNGRGWNLAAHHTSFVSILGLKHYLVFGVWFVMFETGFLCNPVLNSQCSWGWLNSSSCLYLSSALPLWVCTTTPGKKRLGLE